MHGMGANFCNYKKVEKFWRSINNRTTYNGTWKLYNTLTEHTFLHNLTIQRYNYCFSWFLITCKSTASAVVIIIIIPQSNRKLDKDILWYIKAAVLF